MKKRLRKLSKIFDFVYWAILLVLFVIAGLAALSAFGLPKSFRFFVVQSGSMEPAIKTGSLVVVRPENEYKKDDIVTFKIRPDADIQNPGLLITHRIVDVKNDKFGLFFTTKGDANESPDAELRPAGNVLGKVVFSVPYLGYPVGFAKTQNGFILLIVIPATIIVYSEAVTIKNETQRLLAERKKRKLTEKEKIEVAIGKEEIAAESWFSRLARRIRGAKI